MTHGEITSSAKVLAMLGGVTVDEDHEVYEYEDDLVKVIHQGKAVSIWRHGEQDPILVVSLRAKCLYMAKDATDAFDHVREAADRFRMQETRRDT